jgi:hypothetical protein
MNEWTVEYFLREHGDESINVQTQRYTDVKYEENTELHRETM